MAIVDPNTSKINPWSAFPGGKNPFGSVGNPLSGVNAIGDFFTRLTEAATWTRVGEVTLGLLLLIVGLSKLTNIAPPITKLAKAIA